MRVARTAMAYVLSAAAGATLGWVLLRPLYVALLVAGVPELALLAGLVVMTGMGGALVSLARQQWIRQRTEKGPR